MGGCTDERIVVGIDGQARVEMARASSFEHHVDIEIDVLILLA